MNAVTFADEFRISGEQPSQDQAERVLDQLSPAAVEQIADLDTGDEHKFLVWRDGEPLGYILVERE